MSNNTDLELEMYKQRVFQLEKELGAYKEKFGPLDNPYQNTIQKEKTIEQLKDVAQKGTEISKDIFNVSKSIFGKAVSEIQTEWKKQKEEKNNVDQNKNEQTFDNKDNKKEF